MKKAETINTFSDGLIMDIDPLVTPKTCLSNALNATIITMNGEEEVLQNDMGNCKVDEAELPTGYIPLGTTELGGIIYIVSYNPIIDRCQIGSFPSPNKNIFTDINNVSTQVILSDEIFLEDSTVVLDKEKSDNIDDIPDIKNIFYRGKLAKCTLHSGDKFNVIGNSILSNIDNISSWQGNVFKHKGIKLSIATIDSNNRLVYLKDLLKTPIDSSNKLEIRDTSNPYTNIYNTYNSKIAGELYLVAELELIDTFDVTWELINIKTSNNSTTYTLSLDYTYTSESTDITPKYIDITYNGITTRHTCTNSSIEFSVTNPKDFIDITITPVMYFGRYTALKNTLSINTSLIGSELIQLNKWRYYKEDSQLTLQFAITSYLSTKNRIKEINCFLIPCTLLSSKPEIKNDIPVINGIEVSEYKQLSIPKRKSYSGNYTQIISFNDTFQKNTLYLALLQIKYGSDEEIVNKWLYTNGVFNSYWNTYSENDFDNIQLPLEFTINAEANQSDLQINSKTLNSPMYSNVQPSYIEGSTITDISGKIKVDDTLTFLNDFNSFTTDTKVVINKESNALIEENKSTLFNSGLKLDDKVKEQLDITKNIKSNIDYTITDSTINLIDTIEIVNPIISNTILKTLQVNTLYHPLCTNLEELSKYGIYKNDNGELTMTNTFVGLGMCNGGDDLQGGGGLAYVQGQVTLDVNATTNMIEQVAANVENENETNGITGYNYFPNITFSNYINSYSDNYPIVPVLLVNAGTGCFWNSSGKSTITTPIGQDGTVEEHTVYERKLYYFQSGQGRKKESEQKVNYFRDSQPNDYRYLWLFMKSADDNITNTYVPLSNFIKLLVSDGKIVASIENESGETVFGPMPLAYLIASLLFQLYVGGVGENTEVYTVNNFATYKDLQYYLNIPIEASYEVPVVKISNVELFNLQNIYSAQCLTHTDSGGTQNKTLQILLTIPNLLYDTYYNYYIGGKIDSYVKSYEYTDSGDVNLNIPDKISGTLYYKNGNGLSPVNTKIPIYELDTVKISDEGDCKYKLGDKYITTENLTTVLRYGSRTKSLVLNAYRTFSPIRITWGDKFNDFEGQVEDYGSKTTWFDVKIFNQFGIKKHEE